jgi:subtilisin family serine protease
MKRLSAATVLVLSLAMMVGLRDVARARADRPTGGLVGADVTNALAQEPSVRVIVSLRGGATGTRGGQGAGGVAANQAAAAAAADRVSAAVPAAEFAVAHRYRAVAALSGTASAAGVQALAAQPDVISVALDREVRADLAQAVPLIRADDAHNLLGVTGAGVVAAVIDSGIDTDHPMLADSIVYQACYVTAPAVCPAAPNVAEDGLGHGTHVSGIITSNGPPIGVAPGASIEAYKVLDDSGSGDLSGIMMAYDDIIMNHPEVDLINMSLGFVVIGPCEDLVPAFTEQIAATRAMGITTFASSGNNSYKQGLGYPACINDVVSVGAVYDANVGPFSCDTTTAVDQVACFSNSNLGLDLLAPGATITSTYPGGGLATFSGTSMSSPMAVGVAALVLQGEPLLTPADLATRLKETGVPVADTANGVTTCRVNAYEVVIHDGGPVCSSSQWPPPANDNFADAIAIPEPLPYSNVQTTAASTTEVGEPMPCGYIGSTVWYSVTPSIDELLRVSTVGSKFTGVLAVYTGASVDALSAPLACDSPGISFAATAGTTYYIQAGGFGSTSGTMTIGVGTSPPNDDFANAIVIPPELPYSNAQSTVAATVEAGEYLACFSMGATVWYRFTPATTWTITISTAGSGFDSGLALSSGTSFDALTPIDCNRNFGGAGTYARITFVAQAGTTYQIQAGGYQARTGALSIGLTCLFDLDCDSTVDGSDNCPSARNAGQENVDAGNTALNRAGADGLGDACDDDIDGDGYTNAQEAALGKDAAAYCAAMRADVDADGVVTILDLSRAAVKFGQSMPPAPVRLGQDADSTISILDLSRMANVFGGSVSSCT